MTTKSDFTDEEWTRIRRAPLVAGELKRQSLAPALHGRAVNDVGVRRLADRARDPPLHEVELK